MSVLLHPWLGLTAVPPRMSVFSVWISHSRLVVLDRFHLSERSVIFQAWHNLSAPPLNLTGCLSRWLWQSFSPAPWEMMKANYDWSCPHFAVPLSYALTLSIYHSIALSHPVFLSLNKPEVDQRVQPSMCNPQHWPEFPSFSLCFLCFAVPLPLPPHPFISSLLLSVLPPAVLLLKVNPPRKVVLLPFSKLLCVQSPYSQLFTCLSGSHFAKNTCMQDECFQGYRRGTK